MRVDCGGAFWNVVFGSVVGGITSLGSAVVSEIIEGKFDYKDAGQIVVSTVVGAVEGAVVAIVPTSAIAIAAGSSVVETVINDVIDGKDIKTITVDSLVSAVFGAATGAGGSAFSKGGVLIDSAMTSLGNAIKKGVHPTLKRAARKTIGKAKKYIMKAAKESFIEDFAFGALNDFTSWYINAMVDMKLGR